MSGLSSSAWQSARRESAVCRSVSATDRFEELGQGQPKQVPLNKGLGALLAARMRGSKPVQ